MSAGVGDMKQGMWSVMDSPSAAALLGTGHPNTCGCLHALIQPLELHGE